MCKVDSQYSFVFYASIRVTRTSKAMLTTAIGTVANSLPQNEVILLTLLISKRYILFAELRNFSVLRISFTELFLCQMRQNHVLTPAVCRYRSIHHK